MPSNRHLELLDYQTELMRLKRRNKKVLSMAGQKQGWPRFLFTNFKNTKIYL